MLLDFDRFSAADHIGQLKLPLGALDLGNAIDRWAELQIPDSEADKVSHDQQRGVQKVRHARGEEGAEKV